MSAYWLKDAKDRVVGPATLEQIKDLASKGRVTGKTRGSRDQEAWGPLSDLPELKAALLPPEVIQQQAKDRVEAQQMQMELDRFKELPTHKILGVPQHAAEREYKQAFLNLGKRYHPARLPGNSHPELLRACMEMFQFLSGRMVLIEQGFASRRSGSHVPPKAAPTVIDPVEAAAAELAAGPAGQPAAIEPEATAASYLTLGRGNGKQMAATIEVNQTTYQIFTQHKVVNLTSSGVFLAGEKSLPMGTSLDLLFKFREPPREIRARGKVVLECQLQDARHLVGCGVQLERLPDADKAFLHEYIGHQRRQKN
jgi:hypothetical protein